MTLRNYLHDNYPDLLKKIEELEHECTFKTARGGHGYRICYLESVSDEPGDRLGPFVDGDANSVRSWLPDVPECKTYSPR